MREPSVTQPGATGRNLAALLGAARDELRADIARGAGGRTALERYSDRADVLLRQLFAEAPAPKSPVVVLALGGYGRRHLCLHSDIDLLILFGDAIGASEEAFLRAFLHPLWDVGVVVGHQVRELREFEQLETDNPEFLLALIDARPLAGARPLFDRFSAVFHTASTHAFILRSLLGLIDVRHAAFNDTLYQLEPDVKEAPGALRDLSATRTIALLTDPLLLRKGPDRAGALRRRRRLPAARALDPAPRSRTQPERARARAAGAHRRAHGLSGRRGAAARRAADERLLPPRAHRQPLARLGAAHGAAAGGAQSRPVARRHPLHGSDPGRPEPGLVDGRVRSGGRAPHQRVGGSAVVHPAARRSLPRRRLLSRRRTTGPRCVAFLKPTRGLYDRLSEMHDCGLLGRVFPEFQAISWRVVRDFYHKYTVDEHTLLTIRNLERLTGDVEPGRQRFANVLAGLSQPELLVLSLLLHDVGKWRDDDHAVESERMADGALTRLQITGEARDTGAVPHPPSHPDVARRLPPRHRRPGRRQGVRRLRRHRGPAEDAVPHHAGRRRRRQPRHAHAVEGRAAVAALRRHLQPPHAALRRRAHRAQSGRPRPAGGASARRRHQGGARTLRRGAAAALSAALSAGRRSTSTCGWHGTSGPTKCTCRSIAWTGRCGRSPWSRSTSRSSSPTSAACSRRSG